MVLVLVPVGQEPTLQPAALEALARLGVTSLSLLRDEQLAGLVLEGWAEARDYPPDTKYHDTLFEAQAEAQAAGRGIFAPGFGSDSATPAPTTGARNFYGPGATCDPSYPTVCIPPPPPDLDCADIPYRRFTVLPPDPHHFDLDHNGIGCESS